MIGRLNQKCEQRQLRSSERTQSSHRYFLPLELIEVVRRAVIAVGRVSSAAAATAEAEGLALIPGHRAAATIAS